MNWRQSLVGRRKVIAILLTVAMLVTIPLATHFANANSAPVLNWADVGTDTKHPYFDDGVSPDIGPGGLYTFKVRYTDADNDPPNYVRVLVDGVEYALSVEGTCSSYVSGCTYSVVLTLGVRAWHTHQFTAMDVYGNAVTFPSPYPAAGPLVNDGSAADIMLSYLPNLYTADTEFVPFDQASPSVDTYLPLVGHLDTRGHVSDHMFDGLIFTDGLIGPGRYGQVGTHIFVDTVLPSGPLCVDTQAGVLPVCMLDKAVQISRSDLPISEPAYRFGVFFAAPIPCLYGTGLYEDACAANLQDQKDIAVSRVQTLIDRFMHAGPGGNQPPVGLTLVGFLGGYAESLPMPYDGGNPTGQVISTVATYVHQQGLKYLWIPYCVSYGANYFHDWYRYGYDWATLQPNYAWMVPPQGCNPGPENSDDYNEVFPTVDTIVRGSEMSGVEFELAHESRQYEDLRGNARDYLDAGFQFHWDGDATFVINTYFTEGISLMSATTERRVQPQLRATYDRIYTFLHPSVNAALRASATADFWWPGAEPDKANDGSVRSYWSTYYATGSYGHWWRVDLGTSKIINRVTLTFMQTYQYQLRLDGSNNDLSWVVISDRMSTFNFAPQVFKAQTIPQLAGPWRYIRVYFGNNIGCCNVAHLQEVEIVSSQVHWGSVFEYFPTADTYTMESNPTGTYGTSPTLEFGATSSPLSRYHTYLKFDVHSTYMSPGDIKGAYLYMTYSLLDSGLSPDHQYIAAYYIPSDSWSEGTLSWSTATSYPEDSALPLDPHMVYNVEKYGGASWNKYNRAQWDITYRARLDTDGVLSFELRRVYDSSYVTDLATTYSKEYSVLDNLGTNWGVSFWPFLVLETA